MMSFYQLNLGQLLHELDNVDTKHKIRFYEKINKHILLTNYGNYFNQLYIYLALRGTRGLEYQIKKQYRKMKYGMQWLKWKKEWNKGRKDLEWNVCRKVV